ncbi:MAG: DUF881 domain-containing protein [Oscillospiraceae bacterium]|nr:DUF881 domain-containing protein [Oscillospiraceae bacterium]
MEKFNRHGGKVSISVVCIILGLLFAMQFKGVRANSTTDSLNTTRAQTLQELLNEERESNEKQKTQIESLEKELAIYRDAASSDESNDELMARISELEMEAGLTDVSGEGVEVVLNDSKAADTTGDEADYLIHDSDILSVINELRDAGAEALSLNGNRILATSEVRCSGSVVTINGTRTSAPFVIDAIGDSDTMFNALMMRNGVVDVLKQWSIQVDVTQLDDILVPAYSGSIEYKYAHTLTEQDLEKETEAAG